MARRTTLAWLAACGIGWPAGLPLAQDGAGEPATGSVRDRATGSAAEAAGESAREAASCITTTSIVRTEVVDSETVLFFLRGDRVYRNHLTRSCPGLDREKRFMYRTSGNRLCSVDTITVLESRGVGLESGFTCGLGRFEPLSREHADALLAAPADVEARGAVEARPVELPPEEAAAAEPPPAEAAPAPAE